MEDEVKTQGSASKSSKIDSPAMENILDQIPSMIAYINRGFCHSYVNSRYSDEFQTGPDPITGKSLLEVFGEETFAKLAHHMESALSGKTLKFATTIEFHGISKRFEIFLSPDRTDGHAPNGFIMQMTEDSTDESPAKLWASEEKFRAICELAPTVIWMADERGNRSYLNARWTELTGRPPTEAYGENWVDFVHPEDRRKVIAAFREASAEKKSFSLKFRHLVKDGNYALIQSIGIPHIDTNGQLLGLIGIIQNIEYEEQTKKELEEKISERTKQLAQSNDELKKSEERYHHMIDEVQDYSIILLSKDGFIENWNQGAEKIKGYKSSEAIGQHFRIFYPPDAQASGFPERFLKQALEKGRALHEGWRVRKNGSRFWGSVVLTVLHNEGNELIGYSKVTRDLTERKLAEDALIEKNHKLEMMNQELLTFAYVSSHDLQEPLRKIQAFSSRILDLDGQRLTPKSMEYFNIVQNSAHRMRLLIEDILTYSRTSSEPKNLVRTNANRIVDEIIQELKLVIEEKGAVIEVCQLPELHVIPFQFRQLMFNLIANSLKFSKKGVTPLIILSHTIVAANDFPILGREAQQYHQITIIDNGIGFESDYSGKIFEVFQRLHNRDVFEGTGVGLAICKKIVEIHDGAIMAEGKLNHGATFHVFLPVLDIP